MNDHEAMRIAGYLKWTSKTVQDAAAALGIQNIDYDYAADDLLEKEGIERCELCGMWCDTGEFSTPEGDGKDLCDACHPVDRS